MKNHGKEVSDDFKLSVFFQIASLQKNQKLSINQEVANMADENQKDFSAMLHDNKDMPKIEIIEDKKTLKNMVEVKCILHRQLIMTE